MTDQDRPGPDRPDEPGSEEFVDAWVPDLLASARVTGPVPDDVAARLDSTLASLRVERVAGGADAGSDAPVVPLRRRLAPLLAAAAAVLLVAGGAVGVSRLGADHAGSSQSAAGAADSTSADRAEGGSPAPRAPRDQRSDGGLAAVTTALPRLTRATFARDAASVMRRLSADVVDGTLDSASGSTPGTASPPATGDATSPAPAVTGAEQPRTDAAAEGVAPPVTDTPAPQALAAPAATCPGPPAPGAVTVPATLDGTPVALVFRPPTATAQVVEAWSCDGATLLASASVAH